MLRLQLPLLGVARIHDIDVTGLETGASVISYVTRYHGLYQPWTHNCASAGVIYFRRFLSPVRTSAVVLLWPLADVLNVDVSYPISS
jgi:hypothetical protein